MSYLSHAIARMLVEHKMTAADLAQASGMTEAQISRFRNGLQTWISAEDMCKLAGGYVSNHGITYQKAHAELMQAHLLDECSGPGAEYISIQRTDGGQRFPFPMGSDRVVLAPEPQAALDTIRSHITYDLNIRHIIQGIAGMYREMEKAK